MVDFQGSYPNEINNRFDRIRIFILIAHVIVSLSLTLAMIGVISFMVPTRIIY